METCSKMFGELVAYAEGNNLCEPDFKNKLIEAPHALFWELYLPKKLFDSCGVSLKKENEGQNRPDYYFEVNGEKVWIEAVTANLPDDPQQAAPAPTDTFEAGLQNTYAEAVYLRLTQVFKGKIEKCAKYRKEGIIGPSDGIIIAINGFTALNGNSYDNWKDIPIPPCIVNVLFGLTTAQMQNNTPVKIFHPQIPKSDAVNIDIGYFSRAIEYGNFSSTNVNGVLYSNIDRCRPLLDDLTFIQNPMAQPLDVLFKSCPNGRWILESGNLRHVSCVA